MKPRGTFSEILKCNVLRIDASDPERVVFYLPGHNVADATGLIGMALAINPNMREVVAKPELSDPWAFKRVRDGWKHSDHDRILPTPDAPYNPKLKLVSSR